MNVYHENDNIYISNPRWDKIAYTDFDKGLWDKVSAVTWTKNGDYLYSTKLKKYLHQFVMAYWYGQEEVIAAKEKKFVVDHLNNNGFDCRLSNLNFIPDNINKAKGLVFDPLRKGSIDLVALNFFKDFQSNKFQITLGFNQPVFLIGPVGNAIELITMKLLYLDFNQTLLDATNILYNFENDKKFSLSKLSYIDIKYEEAKKITLKPVEKGAAVVWRDGEAHLVLNGMTRLVEIPPDKDWYKTKPED